MANPQDFGLRPNMSVVLHFVDGGLADLSQMLQTASPVAFRRPPWHRKGMT
jgi:hypothetical protein